MSDEKKYPQNCPGNGSHEQECQCDECDRFLDCYPEYEDKEKIMNKNNKKAIKHYLCGAVSAFSVVSAYKTIKKIANKKQNTDDTNNGGHYYGMSSNSLNTIKFDRSKLNTPNSFQFGESGKGRAFCTDHEERILQPMEVKYNEFM